MLGKNKAAAGCLVFPMYGRTIRSGDESALSSENRSPACSQTHFVSRCKGGVASDANPLLLM
jgi:hypothetical protein